MKIRVLSILLAVVMLVGMLPAAVFAAAEAPAMQVSLTLSDSIAINYYVDAADIDAAAFTKVEFYHGDTLLETRTQLPAAEEGKYAFSYKNIDPDMMGYAVTAKLYAGDVTVEATASVSSYCISILQNAASYTRQMGVLAMELLDYGAAAQKYIAQVRGTTVADADLVNYGLAEAYPEIAALCKDEVSYESVLAFDGKPENAQAVWTYAGLYLQDTIVLRYGFTAESVEGMTMEAVSGDQKWTVSEFKAAGDNCWNAYFDALAPTQMRDSVTVTLYKDGQAVSESMTYSIESYIARMSEKSEDAALGTMLLEMLRYGDAAADYAENIPEAPTALWETVADIDFETGTLEDNYCGSVQGSGAAGVLATDVGYNSTNSLQVASGARPKYYVAESSVSAGWYRISGYVKLNGADPSKVYVRPWVMTEDGKTNVTDSKLMSAYIIGYEDENGWSYFEVDVYQAATQYNYQVVFENTSGVTVYYDNFKYEKYLGEGQPERTKGPKWETVADIDFETGTLEDNYCGSVQGSGAVGVLATDVGYNSSKSLQVASGARPKYYVPGTSIDAGWYRISGYVKLNGADPSKVYISPWVKNEDGTNATAGKTMSQYIIGFEDLNGWSYFEVDVYQAAAQTNYQVVFENASGKTVYYDNFKYEKYLHEGQPESTEAPLWQDITYMDFETGTLENMNISQWNDTTNFFALAENTGYESTKSLQIDNGGRIKYYRASYTLSTGWYRISGYVKLNGADPAKVIVNSWRMLADGTRTPTGYALSSYIIGDEDANGWSYFEINTDQQGAMNTFQFTIHNNGAGQSVYFDNITYAKYWGEGEPTYSEPEVKPDEPTEPDVPDVPVEPEDPETPVLSWENIVNIDFETGTLEDNHCNLVQGSTAAGGILATDVGYNSSKSLEVASGARPKYYVSGSSIGAGWYRISGYVKLNGADPSKVYISPWVMTEDGKTNDTSGKLMSDYIVGFEDKNGWSYFEVDVYQAATQYNYQVVFENASGKTVYYDNFKYEKYLEEGQPERTEAPVWQDLVDIDFETGTLADANISQWNDSTNMFSLAENTGYDSGKSLQIDNGGRAKYSQTGKTLAAGWYRISGYVKLNGAAPSKITLTNWEKQVDGTNTVATYNLSDCIFSEEDANGWSYFEIFTQQKASQTTFQFVFNNNNGSGKTVYFDNVKYSKYHGEGTPEIPQWKALVTADFEDGVTPDAVTDDTFVNTELAIVNDGRNGGKAVQVGALSRAKFSVNVGTNGLTKGYYKLSGYVKLGDVDANKASFVIWAYQNSANGSNLIKPNLTSCVVGETVDGWTYFEVIFDHTANYSLIQFYLANGDDTTAICFDDVVYSRYLGDEALEVTPA